MAAVTISLPDAMKAYVDEKIASGAYGNFSEFVRSLIREEQRREADRNLEALLVEGLNSGSAGVANEQFWNDLRGQAAQIAAKRRAKAS